MHCLSCAMPLLQRLHINQVLGFLAAGAIVGPYGLGLWAGDHCCLRYLAFQRPQGIAPLAELGVLFLMFMIGQGGEFAFIVVGQAVASRLVAPETLESGLRLSQAVLYSLGFPETAAARVIRQERQKRIGAVQEQDPAAL